MKVNYKSDGCFYLVGIKKPLSFSNDYKFPQFPRKVTVKEINNPETNDGSTVVRIYKYEGYKK